MMYAECRRKDAPAVGTQGKAELESGGKHHGND